MDILVVGGSSGLGYECARRLAELGHCVSCYSRRGTGPQGCVAYEFDLSRVPILSVDSLKADAILVAGGLGAFYGPHQISLEVYERMFNTNTRGPILLANSYLLAKRKSHTQGRLVFVTSTASTHGGHGLGLYAASKAAVEAWVRSEGKHQAKYGIHLMAASLGWFESPMTDELNPEVKARAIKHCPEGRFATLKEATNFTLQVLLNQEYIGGGVYSFWSPEPHSGYTQEYHSKNLEFIG